MVFSPDGAVLYVAATSGEVFAFDGELSQLWTSPVDDDNLCDITVSPDGLSVKIVLFYFTTYSRVWNRDDVQDDKNCVQMI